MKLRYIAYAIILFLTAAFAEHKFVAYLNRTQLTEAKVIPLLVGNAEFQAREDTFYIEQKSLFGLYKYDTSFGKDKEAAVIYRLFCLLNRPYLSFSRLLGMSNEDYYQSDFGGGRYTCGYIYNDGVWQITAPSGFADDEYIKMRVHPYGDDHPLVIDVIKEGKINGFVE